MPQQTFNEHLVNRDVGGRFDAKEQSAPELSLAANPSVRTRSPESVGTDTRSGEEVLRVQMYVAPGVPTVLTPKGLTETRRALRNARGETGRGLRIVHLSWDSVPPASDGEPLEVVGPKDGRPLIVHVHTGCPTMNITSGNVTVVAGGNGFGITVRDGARATIIGEPGRNVGVTAEPGSQVDFFAEEGVRGYQHIQPGAVFKLNGESDGLTLSTDAR